MVLENSNGITLRQLKEFIDKMPLTDENGYDYEVWVGVVGSGVSNQVVELCSLNLREDGSDLLLEARS